MEDHPTTELLEVVGFSGSAFAEGSGIIIPIIRHAATDKYCVAPLGKADWSTTYSRDDMERFEDNWSRLDKPRPYLEGSIILYAGSKYDADGIIKNALAPFPLEWDSGASAHIAYLPMAEAENVHASWAKNIIALAGECLKKDPARADICVKRALYCIPNDRQARPAAYAYMLAARRLMGDARRIEALFSIVRSRYKDSATVLREMEQASDALLR